MGGVKPGPAIALGLVATYAVLLPAATLSDSSGGMPVTTSISSIHPTSGNWQNHPTRVASKHHVFHVTKHA